MKRIQQVTQLARLYLSPVETSFRQSRLGMKRRHGKIVKKKEEMEGMNSIKLVKEAQARGENVKRK